MSDGHDGRTKEELLAEIAALREALERRDAGPATSASEGGGPPDRSAAPVFSEPLTRRESIVRWVAPVILSMPVVQGVAMVIKPGTAAAATRAPTKAVPTMRPTVAPTATPTAAPTVAATTAPTRAGRCVVVPTTAPTLGLGATPDARPSAAGWIALGGARAAAAASLRS